MDWFLVVQLSWRVAPPLEQLPSLVSGCEPRVLPDPLSAETGLQLLDLGENLGLGGLGGWRVGVGVVGLGVPALWQVGPTSAVQYYRDTCWLKGSKVLKERRGEKRRGD